MSIISSGHRDHPGGLRATGRGVVRAELNELNDLDYRLLELVSWLRVVTQTQLERLHADVPGRTLRYRTQRLYRLGLVGRTRPYRDLGSAPHHLWPTNRADALVRGQPPPRRGERRAPNPLFLAHSAAISEVYVILRTQSGEAGLSLAEFRREGEARKAFADANGRRRAIAPDALIAVRDDHDRLLRGHVELDLGTMTHARLRTKLGGYLAHAERGRGAAGAPPPPVLLFITTSTRRADTFANTVRTLRTGDRWHGRCEDLGVAICARARQLEGLLVAACWRDACSDELMTLRDCLRAAHDRWRS
ncbi:MAG: hypothetical protein V7607_5454 [Solirubrobacteraceae bacterium]